MRYEELESRVESGNNISETVGRIDALNEQLDALLTQQNKIKSQLLEINEGLAEVKRAYCNYNY